MIENISDLKDLIDWAKANKVKRLKLKDIEFELSDIAFFAETAQQVPLTDLLSSEPVQPESPQNLLDDPDLYWSSNS